MLNVPYDELTQTLELMRMRRLSILRPEDVNPEDTRTALDRYYDTLPHVKAERAEEEAERQRQQSIPLNGAAVLRAALAGGDGTINSDHAPVTNSAAALIARELGGLSGRTDHAG
ncbi:hypothetical protein [Rhodococcus rhodochrous]|uniref:hypothetical protein n=1 Tax=Rhodococcus rhodochrous TaxID=1829 RepID=UPI0024BB5D83|nr:hypothetical protein [Rhodococcus rhodochrous]MDJ0400885.1 hypothetical protein [Rhodococcus rhodochrous]